MTLELKIYQEQALNALEDFLRSAQEVGSAEAYQAVLADHERPAVSYVDVPGFPGMPYVCLRIPTGGGKTLLAAHAIGLITDTLLRSDSSIILWLAPSTQIVDQTLTALRDHHHPLRQALEEKLNGRPVEVMDFTEALSLSRGTVSSGSVVLVGTLQALRVEERNTGSRKFYESNGALQHHFTGLVAADLARLERDENGVLAYSLANVLKLHRPVVIMDEAHNARTPLSFETLTRFNPSMVLELTATPNLTHSPARNLFASNVLFTVSAYQLKAEGMIKLPILLTTDPDRNEMIGQAIARRDALEVLAQQEQQATGETIRPIVLYQAQSEVRDDTSRFTPERLKALLMADFQVPEAEIAIATGTRNELNNVNLNDPGCAIRHVITVQALREGWDCPFAYVLCSVANTISSTGMEQLMGRVLRLPTATFKTLADLNRSYAYVTSPMFAPVLETIQKGMRENGFEGKLDDLVMDGSLFQEQTPTLRATPLYLTPTVPLPEAPDLSVLTPQQRDRFEYDNNRRELRFKGLQMTTEDRDALKAVLPSERASTADDLFQQLRAAPSERGERFSVPRLTVRQSDQRLNFERSLYLTGPWPLSTFNASLSDAEFRLGGHGAITNIIDVTEAGEVATQFLTHVQQQLLRLVDRRDWTLAKLALWLDRNISHPDITPREAGSFLYKAIEELLRTRNIDVNTLAGDKYRLRDALARRIDKFRQQVKHQGFEALLGSELIVDDNPAYAFAYGPNYPANWLYSGGHRFSKHYYPVVGELKNQGEEFQCASFIDQLPEVRYWVRNLERQERASFWLPTSTDRFYPDFVAQLHDGRVFVVEYKGADRITNDDSKEKRRIGELWAARSGGKALFGSEDVSSLREKIKV